MTNCILITEEIGERPSETSQNKTEVRSARWLYKETKRMEQNKLQEEEETMLQQYISSNNILSYDQKWEKELDSCKEFTQEYNKFPSAKSEDDYERQLGGWFLNEKTKYTRFKTSKKEKFSDYLEENNFRSFDDIWLEKYKLCEAFVKSNFRLPSKCSKDKNERTIGQWLSHEKMLVKSKEMSEERSELIQHLITSM